MNFHEKNEQPRKFSMSFLSYKVDFQEYFLSKFLIGKQTLSSLKMKTVQDIKKMIMHLRSGNLIPPYSKKIFSLERPFNGSTQLA